MTTRSQYEICPTKKKFSQQYFLGWLHFIHFSVINLRWNIYSCLDGWNFDGLTTDKLFKYLLWNMQHGSVRAKCILLRALRFKTTNTLQIQITNKNIKLFVVSMALFPSWCECMYVCGCYRTSTNQKPKNHRTLKINNLVSHWIMQNVCDK